MQPIQVALVGYLNTLPFEYGLRYLSRREQVQILLDSPAACVELFNEGHANVALLPVGALQSISEYEIFSQYCIGCDGPVRTVMLMSTVPLGSIEHVYLDMHSRTSRLLVQWLIDRRQSTAPHYRDARIRTLHSLKQGEACLMIGDKVFEHEGSYPFTYDLGALWKEETGMPFVFAVWVKKTNLPLDEDSFNKAFAKGMAVIPELVNAYAASAGLPVSEVNTYISNNLRYDFHERQQEALQYFLNQIS